MARECKTGAEISDEMHALLRIQRTPLDGGKPPHIRWMIKRDMPESLQCEQQSWLDPWTEEDFLRNLRQRNCIGMVAEEGLKILGFMIYELHKKCFQLLNTGVIDHPEASRTIEALSRKLASKISEYKPYVLTGCDKKARRTQTATPEHPTLSRVGSMLEAFHQDLDTCGFAQIQIETAASLEALLKTDVPFLTRAGRWVHPLTKYHPDGDGIRYVRKHAAMAASVLAQIESAAKNASCNLYAPPKTAVQLEVIKLRANFIPGLPKTFTEAGMRFANNPVKGFEWMQAKDQGADFLKSSAAMAEYGFDKDFYLNNFLVHPDYKESGVSASLADALIGEVAASKWYVNAA